MKIKISIGDVSIEFSEETDAGSYPTITWKDHKDTKAEDGRRRKLIEGIKELADKASEISQKIHG